MKPKMRDEDRRAVDLLLDRTAIAAGKTPGVPIYATADGRIRQSVAVVEKVLMLLDNMPRIDPPRNLVLRTLKLVERSSGRPVAHPHVSPFSHPPVA